MLTLRSPVAPGSATSPVQDQPGETCQAAAYLEDVAAELRAPGLAVRTNVRIGEPAREIAEIASEQLADLVVMATHGRAGLGRAILGSVADAVVRAAQAAVLLVRRGQAASATSSEAGFTATPPLPGTQRRRRTVSGRRCRRSPA
jgi:nucleotide-binding universal stress UspA family protein